jgi:hypothetical protein
VARRGGACGQVLPGISFAAQGGAHATVVSRVVFVTCMVELSEQPRMCTSDGSITVRSAEAMGAAVGFFEQQLRECVAVRLSFPVIYRRSLVTCAVHDVEP